MLSGMSLLAFRTTERAPGSRSGQRAVLEQELDMVSDCAAAGRLRIASLFGKAPQAAISVRAWGRGRRSSFTLHRDRRSCVPVSMLLRKDNKRSSTTSWPARRPPRYRQPGSSGLPILLDLRASRVYSSTVAEDKPLAPDWGEWPDPTARQRAHQQPCSSHRWGACDQLEKPVGGRVWRWRSCGLWAMSSRVRPVLAAGCLVIHEGE